MPTTNELFPKFQIQPDIPSPIYGVNHFYDQVASKELFHRRLASPALRDNDLPYTLSVGLHSFRGNFYGVNLACSYICHSKFVGNFYRCSFYNVAFLSCTFSPQTTFFECDFTGAAFNNTRIHPTIIAQLTNASLSHIIKHALIS